jgi:hypothetical protein
MLLSRRNSDFSTKNQCVKKSFRTVESKPVICGAIALQSMYVLYKISHMTVAVALATR